MKYFDTVNGMRILLYTLGGAGLLISIGAILYLPFGMLDANNCVIDDVIVISAMFFFSSVCLICGLLFTRRYVWVWRFAYFVSAAGPVVMLLFSIIYLAEWMVAYDVTIGAIISYWICCGIFSVTLYIKIREVKVKAMFRIYKRVSTITGYPYSGGKGRKR